MSLTDSQCNQNTHQSQKPKMRPNLDGLYCTMLYWLFRHIPQSSLRVVIGCHRPCSHGVNCHHGRSCYA